LLHQLEDFIIHVGAVLDRGDAAHDGTFHAFLAVRMRGDAEAVILGGFHHGAHFIHRELRCVATFGIAEHATGSGNLDDIRAVLVTLAHGGAAFFRAVDDALSGAGGADCIGQKVAEAVGRIGMTAGGGDGFTGCPDARPFYQALIDSVT